jgi:hypothetical protein
MKFNLSRKRLLQGIAGICVGLFISCAGPELPKSDPAELHKQYMQAVEDAKTADPDEVSKNLVAIVPDNKDLFWKADAGEKWVLMLTWTSSAEFDGKEGEYIGLGDRVWVTAVPELKNFCKKNKLPPEKVVLRLEQLMGLPPGTGKTKFVEIWTLPDDIFRPAPDYEITDTEAQINFPSQASETYKNSFNELKKNAYGENGYPWTRLGYTYDWGNPESEVGLSEFVLKKGATVRVHSVSDTVGYCCNPSEAVPADSSPSSLIEQERERKRVNPFPWEKDVQIKRY